ncbi:Sas10/Utp3/C1D family-domain-containing protein [Neohortaea acidophila]|uniref:Exosome complex protein n=1 Tax=Neohortaea acidophila TaxID=245834 RepID=A0A6A6PQ57_9PEZI|nr:Sas10/Utp3/C1D family-domain-containing protein [Neohortaea acidophila]KAF2482065.1 Sas10/Utp3/C1D family-domain-containing protein [Neohortaea acidophila]
MEPASVAALVEDLENTIDDLEDSLQPLVKTHLSTSTSKLPLLDKAKAYVLATYALESILFSSLRLHGVDAKAHPVFQELARVKEYFGKIKAAETSGATRPHATLDKEAAQRFIRHGLAGNDRFDRERGAAAGTMGNGGAKRKLEDVVGMGKHTKLDGVSKRVKAGEGAGEYTASSSEVGTPDASARDTDPEMAKAEKKAARKLQRKLEKRHAKFASIDDASTSEVVGSDAASATLYADGSSEHESTTGGVDEQRAWKKPGKPRHKKSKGMKVAG